MSAADSKIFVLALALRGCATTEPASEPRTPEQNGSDGRCSPGKDWGRARDELGRLITGPGLCRVVGVSKRSSPPIFDVTLDLRYDRSGRPVEASAEFSPNCPSEGPFGTKITDPACWAYEEHTQRWAWDGQGRLVGAERRVSLWVDGETSAENDRESAPAKLQCLAGDEPVLIESVTWVYDGFGRLESSTSNFSDCDETEVRNEVLRYDASAIEAKVELQLGSQSSSNLLRYSIEDCGRVVSLNRSGSGPGTGYERYEYDEYGRMVRVIDSARERPWTYEAGVVSSSAVKWTAEMDRESRTLVLIQERDNGYRYEIRFDERQRVIAVESDYESWTLEYDGCENGEFAQTRWRIGDILSTWTFVNPPQPGKGLADLDDWSYGALPLSPEWR